MSVYRAYTNSVPLYTSIYLVGPVELKDLIYIASVILWFSVHYIRTVHSAPPARQLALRDSLNRFLISSSQSWGTIVAWWDVRGQRKCSFVRAYGERYAFGQQNLDLWLSEFKPRTVSRFLGNATLAHSTFMLVAMVIRWKCIFMIAQIAVSSRWSSRSQARFMMDFCSQVVVLWFSYLQACRLFPSFFPLRGMLCWQSQEEWE